MANEDLGRQDLPGRDAPWEDIVRFGHTFHAYRVAGSVPRVSQLAAEDLAAWEADGTLPDDLTRLRMDLFALVRSLADDEPASVHEAFGRALTGAIRTRIPAGG